MPKMFKEAGSARNEWIIVRLDKKLFIMVNDEKKEYSELTFDEIEQVMKKVGGQMSEQMKEVEKQLASLPPEQRKMMQEMMGGKIPGMKDKAKIDVKMTGEKSKISEYSCSKYVVTRDGKDFMSLWTTQDIKGVEKMGEEMKELGKRMAALNPMGDQAEFEAMMGVEGFPIRTEMANITTTVTKVVEKSIPTGEFAVPAGYKKVKSEMMKGLQEGMK
jgi:hypothetical protein